MKKFTSTITVALLTLTMFLPQLAMSQSPQKMSYQTVIRNATDDLVTNSPVGIRVSILQDSATGVAVFTETHLIMTNTNGLASLEVGVGNPPSVAFGQIDWSNGPYFIKSEIDLTGGTNYTLTGTTELLSVPYALFARKAGNATFTTSGDVTTNAGGDYTTDDFVFGSPQSNDDGNPDHDARMFFDKSKAAFRVGATSFNGWDDQNVGVGSIGIGTFPLASGDHSIALGWGTLASGDYSTSIGFSNDASGSYSAAMGYSTTARSFAETVIGIYNTYYTPQSSNQWNDLDRLFVIGNGYSSGLASDAMVVLKNGNIGLGTSTPNEVLEVGDEGRAFFGDGQGDNRKGLLIDGIQGENAARIEAYDYGTGTGMDLILNSSSGGGNVGIRTNLPTATLSVNGSANNITGSWSIFSDARIKTVNSEFTDGLKVIKALRPVRFNYNEDAPFQSDDEQIGLIAQELEKVAPYMVNKTEDDKIMDLREVNPQAYTFLLINAVKEQQEIIENLQAVNSELKAENSHHLELIKANTKLLQELNSILKTQSKR